MPLVKRLVKVGNSRMVSIPPDWLKFYEDKTGIPVEEVLMELNGVITIYIKPQENNIPEEVKNG
jgi:hypothetical protein